MSASINSTPSVSVPSTSTPSSISYAPYVEPVTGTRKLCCVSIKWKDNAGADLQSVTNSCDATAVNFKRLSNGQFNFEPVNFRISVPYDRSAANVPHAVSYAKKMLVAQGVNEDGNTTYVMVNNNAETNSHSGGDTSNLIDTLTTTFYHEIGRDTPTDLGSSGAFINGTYVDQADGSSFMGHFASNDLTASQLYYLGWLPNTQVALYDNTSATVEYTMDALDSETSDGNIKAVLIPDVAGKPLFFSKPKFKNGPMLALHLASSTNQRGSQRVGVFAQSMDYSGLSFEEISQSGDTSVVRISPQLKPSPGGNPKAH